MFTPNHQQAIHRVNWNDDFALSDSANSRMLRTANKKHLSWEPPADQGGLRSQAAARCPRAPEQSPAALNLLHRRAAGLPGKVKLATAAAAASRTPPGDS